MFLPVVYHIFIGNSGSKLFVCQKSLMYYLNAADNFSRQYISYHFKSGAWGPMNFGNINAWASMCKSVQLGKKMSFILEQIKSLNKLKSSTLIRINPFDMDRLEACTIYYVFFRAHQKGWVYPNQCGAIYLNGLAKSKNFHFYLQYCKQFGLFIQN